jgi:hypothetical protein
MSRLQCLTFLLIFCVEELLIDFCELMGAHSGENMVAIVWSTLELYGIENSSAWKSSPKTGKRPRLDWTKTAEDWKFPGPSKTATAVRSSVSNNSGNFKTDKRPV